MLRTYLSQRLPRFLQANILHFQALFWCIGKFLSLPGPISIQTKNPMFGVLHTFSSRSCLIMSFKSDAIVKHDCFSPMFSSASAFRYLPWSYHLENIVGWLPCMLCLAFLSICFALWNITCLSEAPRFGPRVEFFWMTKPGIEVKSQLVFWSVVGLREYFTFLPQLQWMMPISERHCNQDIEIVQNSRKVQRSLCGWCPRVIFVIPRWTF